MIVQGNVAVRIDPDLRTAVVGVPSSFAGRPKPRRRRTGLGPRVRQPAPADAGRLYRWEFEKDGRSVGVRVDGRLVLNASIPML